MALNEHFIPENFPIRPGTVDYGKEYEVKMSALLSLRSVAFDKTQDTWLAMNVDECGAFDDLILYIQTENGDKITYLIQLKHKMEPTDIGAREFKTKKGDYLLEKYYDTISQIKNTIDKGEKTCPEIIRHFQCNPDKIAFILFTNRGTIENDFLQIVRKKSVLDNTWLFSKLIDTNGTMSLFDYEKLEFKFEDSIRSYMDRFFLFTNQIHINKLNATIEVAVENLIKPLKLQTPILKEVVHRYLHFLTDWSKGELGGFYPLTKTLVFKVLLQHLFTPYMVKLNKYDDVICEGIWSEIMQEEMVTVTEADEVVLKFLNGYIDNKIKDYCIHPEHKNLWKRHPDLVSKQLLRTTARSKEIRPSDAYECLWKLGKVPLLLMVDNSEEYNCILHLLSLFKHIFRVVVLTNSDINVSETKLKTFKSIVDLQAERKISILKYPVQLQSRLSVKLLDILNENLLQFITVKDIIYILTGEFNIGNKLPPLPEEFVERSLEKVWLRPNVLQEVSSDIFLIKCNPFCDLKIFLSKHQLQFNDAQILECNNFPRNFELLEFRIIKVSEDIHLDQIHVNLSKSKTIHYLILHDVDNLEWIKSFGTIKNIVNYRKNVYTSQCQQIYSDRIIVESIDETMLISATPGMGKSVLMDYLALNAATNMWVFRINLFEYVDYYKCENFQNLEPLEYLQYFYSRKATEQKCDNDLVRSVFQKYLDAKKVLLLFDGYDEIPLSCQENASKMIRSLHDLNYYMYVTTRPISKIHLEKLLDTFAVSINSFNKVEQSTFLTKYYINICSSIDKKDVQQLVKVYVDKLLCSTRHNLNDHDQEFTGVPLQTKLLAEVFVANCNKYIETELFEDIPFDLLYLYKHFIDQKFRIVCARFGNNSDDMLHHYRTYRSYYALRLLFTKDDLEKLNLEDRIKQLMQMFPDSLQHIQKDGIVVAEKESNVTFVHRTFAEYLSALWLSENINTENREITQTLIKKTFDPSFVTVRNIFDRIVAKNCPLHLAVLNRQLNVVNELLVSNNNALVQRDKANRSFLHLIAAWGVHHPFSIELGRDIAMLQEMVVTDVMIKILKIIPNRIICSKDDLLCYTELDYAIVSGSLNIADAICVRLEHVNECISLTDININYSFYLKHFPYGALGSILIRQSITAEVYHTIQQRKLSNSKEDELHYEIINGDVLKASLLLTVGKDINKQDYKGFTPLHVAILSKQTLIIQLLLSNKVDLTKRDNSGKTPLHWSVTVGELKIISLLISNGIDVDVVDNNGMTALHYAIVENIANSTEIISLLLNSNASIILQDNYGKTPLHYALHYNQIEILKLLLNCGANIRNKSPSTSHENDQNSEYLLDVLTSKDTDGGTVLHWASDKGFSDIVSLFLSYGAPIEVKDDDGRTPLHWAAEKGHTDVVSLLLSHKAEINAKDNSGRTPLYFASDSCNIDTLQVLILKGASIDEKDNLGRTPLLQAIAKNFVEAINLLLSYESCLNIKDYESMNALHWAAWNGNETVTKLLLCQGQAILLEEQNSDGRTALILAAFNGHSSVTNLLLETGANIKAKDKQNMNSLYWASWNGHLNAVEVLLSKIENIESEDEFNRTPLICAAHNGHAEIVNVLLLKGANVEAKDNQLATPLNWAAYNGSISTVTILLTKGNAALETFTSHGRTPLTNAANNGHTIIVRTLLAKGADLEARDQEGMNALHCAVSKGHMDTVKLLLDDGADLEAKSKYDKTALIYAADYGYTTILILLLSRGVNIEATDNENMSALTWAAHNGHTDIVNLLISFGANLEIKNRHGRTPLICAAQNGHKEIVRSLISHANTETLDNGGIGAFHWAAYNGFIDIVDLFLDKGLPLDLKDGENRTPLVHAAFNGHIDLVSSLISKGAQIDEADTDDMTALHWASLNGHREVVEFLLFKGASLERKDKYKRTALINAITNGHLTVVVLLLGKGADLEVAANENKTALHFAALKAYKEIVELLISIGANIEAVDDCGRTVLMYSATRGDVATAALLISRGANIHAQDNEGLTALDWSKRNHQKSTELFLRQQLDYSFQNPSTSN